ncbi:MAG: O-acetyl-ADP-ribose deacetylase [Clostridiales bacterium]|nr:O-acetyl-ADP-ribose deacetylase [Clostridiales bacterium]
MPLIIVRNDITEMKVDAIVNAANESLLGGGGVDGAIHRAAGRELLNECRTLGGCRTGEAKYTGAYKLPCRYVIHTVGPVWQGGDNGEEALLRACYRNSLRIAKELSCGSVAFPMISAGVYGYPKREAFEIASSEVRSFLEENEMTVYLVVFDRPTFLISRELADDIAEYVDDNYCREHLPSESAYVRRREAALAAKKAKARENRLFSNGQKASRPALFAVTEDACRADAAPMAAAKEELCFESAASASDDETLEEKLRRMDESFSRNLLRRIDASGMTDAECYKRANVDRKLFSKIRSDESYRPSKSTALAFAVALGLDLEQTKDLIRRAGFALSNSSKFDVIVEYFISHGIHDVFEINEALFAFDQTLLGAQG